MALRPSRVLILGEVSESVIAAASKVSPSVRVAEVGIWATHLKQGCYAVRQERDWYALVVGQGAPSGPQRRAEYRFDSSDLAMAKKVLGVEWGSGRDLSSAPFKPGDTVRILGTHDVGIVERVTIIGGGAEVYVRINGQIQQFSTDSMELIDGDPSHPHYWVQMAPSSADDFAFALTVTKLQNALSDVLYSYSSSKTVFRPYQFIPVIKMLNSSTGRLLIADEVGLGKTIEAGLIWSELEQRTSMRRILLVTPASLRVKWRREMLRRFDRRVDILNIESLQQFADDLRDGQDPEICGVISIESLRRPKRLLEDLVELSPQFDLVIVDEAHSLRSRDTVSFHVGTLLSDWAENLLFLSATPLNLGTTDLFNLLNLLQGDVYVDIDVFKDQLEPNEILNRVARELTSSPSVDRRTLVRALRGIESMAYGRVVSKRPDYHRLVSILGDAEPLDAGRVATAKKLLSSLNTLGELVSRTRKIDVPDAKAVREPLTINVEWTEQERQFYQGVEDLFRAKAEHSGAPPGFIMQMPLRQAASCIPAAQEYLRDRAKSHDFDDVEAWQDEWIEEGLDDDPETISGGMERRDALALQSIANRAGAVDTKLAELLKHLRKLRADGMRQVMIFSFFRRTLSYLRRELSSEFTVRVMNGLTPVDERENIMSDFRAGAFELLLVSEVGSEGLDFEFCNVLVNYDLPWNPMRVEQRIGRLDRFGQQHNKIFIINMHVPGTIETDIFERLYERIGIFRASIGDLEPILQDEFRDIAKKVLDPRLTPEQRRSRADQIAVAVEKRRQDIAALTESKGLLSYVDRIEIDGMTDQGPSDGRYIGPSEVRRVLERLVGELGGRITARGDGSYKLDAGPYLIREFSGFTCKPGRGDVRRVQQDLAGDRPYLVTFDSGIASKTGTDLISSRHPLIRFAGERFADRPALHRLGSVAVPDVEPGRSLLARVDVATSTGLSPRREMWVTAIDMESGHPVPSVEGSLLTALAEGSWQDARVSRRPPDALVSMLDDVCARRRREEESRRRAENEALADARAQAKRQLLERKVDRARGTLGKVSGAGRSESVVRIYRGRIRNLSQELDRVDDELNRRRRLDLSVRAVAYALVNGGQP